MSTAPGWYPDPSGTPAALRYWDGSAWTEHVSVPSGAFRAHWKGQRYGLPATGAGSLAEPWRRLIAQLLDGLFLVPVYALVLVVAFVVVLPGNAAVFPSASVPGSSSLSGVLRIEFGVLGAFLLASIISPLYQALTTGWFERSPGKAILRIRPVELDGARLSWGRAFARAFTYWGMALVSMLLLIDVLWCLWDDDVQCLHDKVCSTLVVSDVAQTPATSSNAGG